MVTIDAILKDVYIECPLYGEVLINCTRIEDPLYPFIAAVSSKLELLINPDKMKSFTTLEKKAIIIHEILHLVMQHHQRFNEIFHKNKTLCNYAMDCAINQLIPNLPVGCITLDTIKRLTKNEKLEANQCAEYYYKNLLFAYEKYKKDFPIIEGEFCQHDELFSDNLTPFEQMMLEEVINKAIEKQKQHNLRHGTEAGNQILNVIPQRQKCIDKNLWKSAIKRNFGDTPNGNFDYVYGIKSRVNKDSMYGKKRKLESTNIYVGLDTSGSVSDTYLSNFISQINAGMSSSNCTVTLIQCDAEITNVSKFRKIPPQGFKVIGRGGTNLTKIPQWISKNRPKTEKKSYLILLTDGATPWVVDSSIQTTVIYTPNHQKIPGIHLSAVIF